MHLLNTFPALPMLISSCICQDLGSTENRTKHMSVRRLGKKVMCEIKNVKSVLDGKNKPASSLSLHP